jgi:endonuclease/exonuclease/phosphatase family metal-dependent hydrolase
MRLVREIPLPRTYHDPVPRRHALHVELEVGGAVVDLVAFHVSSKLWFGAPPIQLLGLRRAVKGLGRSRPAILAGDANWWRTTLPVWLPGWRPTVRGATYSSRRPHSQIDHVLMRGGVECVAAAVAESPSSSDHLAIRATLRLPPSGRRFGDG